MRSSGCVYVFLCVYSEQARWAKKAWSIIWPTAEGTCPKKYGQLKQLHDQYMTYCQTCRV